MANSTRATPTRCEERSLLTRAAYDTWLRQCWSRGVPAPTYLPWNFAPVGREEAQQIVAARPSERNGARVQQSVYSLSPKEDRDDLVRMSITDPEELGRYDRDCSDPELCDCCAGFRAGLPEDSLWDLRHKHTEGTSSTFDPRSQVTEVKSTLMIRSRRDPLDDEVASLMRSLAIQFDPSQWKVHGPESFRRSDPITFQPGFYGGWSGTLLEEFDWSWNPRSTVSIENVLNVDYQVSPRAISLDYSLRESLSSKLFLARQAGGLDIDRGQCRIVDQQWREVRTPSRSLQRAIDEFESDEADKSQKVFSALADATADSPSYNIAILATKRIRFTEVEGGPSWFGGLLNYLSPVMASIWMSRAVHAGACQAIANSLDHLHPQLLLGPATGPRRERTGQDEHQA